ncbi:PREDICTED: olfactory receptor 51Q1-like [Ceratotherium simum simum]|uniref:Olfactory receptor n=1 Tax=Ceratotherium simum simum TaxID=73337 RepID=A0ABM1D1F5_CERSS|nr:PREDICTED: olfactory receptor 51Q1-like [Ceratotherium simum simum]
MFSVTNSTQVPFYFILTGIPGFEVFHAWISIPFCCLYTISIMGNTTILAVIRAEPSLHEPMYLFLSMLALTDLGLTLTTLPTVMGILWFSASEISFEACFAQFFFLHGFSFMESSVLLAMSFDRYVAICHPLHYISILTNRVIRRIGIAIICRCFVVVLPGLFLLKQLPFCGSKHLSHSYCLHQDMIHLVCADTTINNWYGFVLALLIITLNPLLIVFSYALILRSVLRIGSQVESLRALNNCLSHILAVFVLYVPMVGLSMTHRFAKHAPPLVHVIMANIYLLAPPVMNPIIYSVKTKQIRGAIFHLFSHRQL